MTLPRSIPYLLLVGARIIAIALFVITLVLVGCGTTHQFFPPAPIEKKQWQVTVNWHFDVGRPLLTVLEPECSVYYGIDQQTNLGFGAQFPFMLSQVSLAHYEPTHKNYWMTYFTANQVFGFNDNPYLEAGISYNLINQGYWQMHRLGVAYGHGLPVFCGLYNLAEGKNELGILTRKRLIPVVGYSIGGTELAFSYVHYHGATKSASRNLRDMILYHNDTLAYYTKSDVDSVMQRPAERIGGWFFSGPSIIIYPRTGDSIVISIEVEFYGCIPMSRPLSSFLDYESRIFHGKERWENLSIYDPRTRILTQFRGNFADILNNWYSNGVLVIRKYDDNMADQIRHLSDWSSDHSFAIGQIAHIHVARHK